MTSSNHYVCICCRFLPYGRKGLVINKKGPPSFAVLHMCSPAYVPTCSPPQPMCLRTYVLPSLRAPHHSLCAYMPMCSPAYVPMCSPPQPTCLCAPHHSLRAYVLPSLRAYVLPTTAYMPMCCPAYVLPTTAYVPH